MSFKNIYKKSYGYVRFIKLIIVSILLCNGANYLYDLIFI
jgi:hypothetical protein